MKKKPGKTSPWPLRPVKTLIPGVPGLMPTQLVLECGHTAIRSTASVSQLPHRARCYHCWKADHNL